MRKVLVLAFAVMCMAGCGQKSSETQEKTAMRVIHLTDLPAVDAEFIKSTPEEHFYYLRDRLIVHSDLADSIAYCSNPFLMSARTAYAQHRPLVINPDVVWMVIESGFAHHVDANAEELRSKFVPFKGKETLELTCMTSLLGQPADVWTPFFPKFTEQMKQWMDSTLLETLQADFSTTTPVSYIASNILIMSAMQHYFEYSIICICGIPDIYLEGTAADWRRLIDKTQKLREYDLDWWIDELVPVLEKIALAAEGEDDIAFWQSIINKKDLPVEGWEVRGWTPPHEKIDGWIVKFYPYTDNNNRRRLDFIYDTDIRDLAPETGTAPLKYTDWDGTVYDLDIYAGLVGFEEDSTRALRPVVGWWICERDEEVEIRD